MIAGIWSVQRCPVVTQEQPNRRRAECRPHAAAALFTHVAQRSSVLHVGSTSDLRLGAGDVISLGVRETVLYLRGGANMQLDRWEVHDGSRRGPCMEY